MKSPLKKALDLSTNKFVSACAGAGKTFALSKRYCKILDEFTGQNLNKSKPDWLGVKNILVITFTNKAAAEMSGRIYEDLNILLNGNEIDALKEQDIELGENIRQSSEEYKRWLRATFSQNYISTIDGFCGKILRENAHLIGIDPKFRTYEDVQTGQIFVETLEEFLQQKSEKFDKNLQILLDNVSVYKVRQFIEYLFENRAFVQDWLEFIRKDEEEIKEKWIELYTPDCDVEFLKQNFIQIVNFSQYYSASENDKGILIFENLKQYLTKLETTDFQKEKQRIILAEILPLFQTGSGTYFKAVASWRKTNWENESIYQEFKGIVIDFCNYLREELPENEILKAPNEYDFKAISVLKSLVAFYEEFAETLWQKQLELNFLNFDDIILKTKELLHNGQIRQKYSSQFRHIMVDEFQDTNDVRWEIIKLISEDSREEHEETRRKEAGIQKHSEELRTFGSLRKSGIFIVGDKKQSIYRFNQADVEVMNRAEEELTHFHKQDIVISFNDNYRSSQDLIECVINPLFSRIMPFSEKPFEAEFEPTTSKVNKQTEKTENVCTIQSVQGDTNTTSEDLNRYSAMNTATIVQEHLNWAEETKLDEKVVVGVLLRKFTNIQNYLKVFQEQDIPFEIIGGRGLFQQQEIYDLFHFVSVLINPFDDLALIGLLRSPFLAISDKQINHLKNRKKEQPVFAYMKELSEFEKVVMTIENWRNKAQILSLDMLLQKILLSEVSSGESHTNKIRKVEDYDELRTENRSEFSEFSDEEKVKEKLRKGDGPRYPDSVSTRRCAYESNKIRFGYFSEIGGYQRISNIEKILNILHELSLEGSSLKNVYNFLKFQIANNHETSQAETPSSAKVQILTIHRSKGLEFPTVIIPEMNSKGKSDSSPISHGRIIKNGRIEVGISLDEEGESKKMNLLNSIKKQAKSEIEAEDKRLFYVAVTRAKYRIAFLSEIKEKQTKSHNFWNDYIRPCYEIPDDLDPEEWKKCNLEKTEINLLSVPELNKKIRQKTESEPIVWENPPVPNHFKKFLKVSPHDLMKLVSKNASDSNKEQESSEIALSFGTIIHKIMEEEWWEIEDFRLKIEDYLTGNFPEITFDSISDELKRHLANFQKSELYPILSKIPAKDKFPELPVSGWMENPDEFLQVSGIIDLLYKYGDKWFILDYKTDKDKNNLEQYKVQIQTYIWMVKQLYGFDAVGQIFFTNFGELENLTPALSCEEREKQRRTKPTSFLSGEEIEKQHETRLTSLLSCEEREKKREELRTNYDFEENENLKIICEILKKDDAVIKPQQISTNSNEPNLPFSSQEKGQRNEILIINPTWQQCLSQIRSFAGKKLLHPRIQIVTLTQLLKSSKIQGKKISFNFAKLLIRKLVSDKKYPDGMIELLTDAILKNEKYESGLKPEFREIENQFRKLKKDKKYITDADVIKRSNLDLSEKKIILNGFYKESPIEFDLLKRISKSAGKFYFIDNFSDNKLKTKFEYSQQIWENAGNFPSQKYDQTCELCFSVQEEVKRVSELVLSIPDWQEKLDSIKIAVSSLERYVPTISAIFSDYGIPFRSTKNEPILKIPIIQLLLSYVELLKTKKTKWEMIFDVFLHPLLEPDDEMFLLEKFCRQKGIVYFDESNSSRKELMTTTWNKTTTRNIAAIRDGSVSTRFMTTTRDKIAGENSVSTRRIAYESKKNDRLAAMAEESFLNHPQGFGITEKISDFIRDENLKEKIANDQISSSALDRFVNDLKIFEKNYQDIGLKTDLRELITDFKKHLQKVDIYNKEQIFGIEVMGVLDSLEIPAEHLFILGLTEGDFPIPSATNPFLKNIPDNKWSYSLLLLNHWQKLRDRVRYFAPERDIDGTVLQPSTFLEILNVVKSSDIPEPENIPKSRKEHFGKYYDRPINNPEKNRYLQRHNEFLKNEISEFTGKTEKQDTKELEISASRMDKLLKCPQRFWYSSFLKLEEIDLNENLIKAALKGDIIHRALEIFGKNDGFIKNRKDIIAACSLLSDKLETEFKSRKINPDENLLQKNFFKIFLDGLREGKAANILVRLLEWNREMLSNFQEAEFEQPFGINNENYPDSWNFIEIKNEQTILKFRGIIDKILIDKEKMEIIATDYKTGFVNYKDILDEISSQFIIYYFALKEHFPDHSIKLSYEMIKSLKKREHGISGFIEIDKENDLLLVPYNRKQIEMEVEEIKNHYLSLAENVISGYFPVAEKDKQQKSCKYCEFERICRKGCYGK